MINFNMFTMMDNASPLFTKTKGKRFFILYGDKTWNEVPDGVTEFQAPFIEWDNEDNCAKECTKLATEVASSLGLGNVNLYIAWGTNHNSKKCGVYIVS